MKQIIILITTIVTFFSCQGQEQQNKELKVTDFTFESIFGSTLSEPKSIYCLLGTGFFKTPRSTNSDSLIADWIKLHTNAIVLPVSSFGPTEKDYPESKMVYCWIIDKKDTLNNYLIKEGCFPGGTMTRPKTWEEMEKWEKELYEEIDEKPNVKVLVTKEAYNKFLEQIKISELFARKEKLGVWEIEIDNE